MANTGVVYLCRFAEGEAPVRRFVDSYRAHPAGLPHDLHVIFKGFPDRHVLISARGLFGALPINTIELDDADYDIGSYIAAAKAVANSQLLFLNTFSEILADNWLVHFDKALALPGVGLVGATGSWQSIRSRFEAVAISILRNPLAGMKTYFSTASLTCESDVEQNNSGMRPSIGSLLFRLMRYPLRVYQFRRHPNPHIRTNAFMVRRELFLSLRRAAFKRKIDVYKFESGRQSMTRQVMARGLRPVVVDRCGKVYDIHEWRSASTFWIDLQDNLLVADNQTSGYATADLRWRKALKNRAWDNPWSWDSLGPG